MTNTKVTMMQAYGGLLLFLDGANTLSKLQLELLLRLVREHQEKNEHTDAVWDVLAEVNILLTKKIKEKK